MSRSVPRPRRPLATAAALAAAALTGGCAYPYTPPALAPATQPAPPSNGGPLGYPVAGAMAERRSPVTILVSIDGFRADYLERGVTPAIARLAAAGVTGPMRPSFPSKTFPNHWTLVTGVVPDRHGIVGNSFVDPARPDETFTMASDDPFWWNAAEPIWVTAEKAGIRTATMFWPGSNVAWGGTRAATWPHDVTGGTRPQDWQQFNEAVDDRQRVDAVIDWLRRPAATRPRLVTLYFEEVDHAGHRYGPDDAHVNAALAAVDRSIAMLTADLAALGQPANIVLVADHGMAATAGDRTIALDTLLPPAAIRTGELGPYAAIRPVAGQEAAVAAALLHPHAHMQCWPRERIPARFHYGTNPRIAPILCLAADGWTIAATAPAAGITGGNHGYDNRLPDMRALFVASGPSFRAGRRIAAFDNVDVAPLLRDLLGLPSDPSLDGTDRPFRPVMRR